MSAAPVPAPPRPRRRVGRWVALTAAVAVAVGVVGVARLLPPRQSADVPVPLAGAAPESVVVAYLQAVDVHDCATADALTAGSFATSASNFCDDAQRLVITELTPLPHLTTATRASVSTSFLVTWRAFHDDGSIPEDGWWWTYDLARAAPGDPWRIVDAGTG